MRQKLNLKDKCQISKPNEYTDNVKSNLTCIFLSVRAKLKKKHFALGHCVDKIESQLEIMGKNLQQVTSAISSSTTKFTLLKVKHMNVHTVRKFFNLQENWKAM